MNMQRNNRDREFTTTTERKLIDGEVFTIERIYNRNGILISTRVIKTQGVYHEQ